MSRYIGSQCKLCRRERVKLFLKGTRCETAKCALSKRDYPPGEHRWRRGKPSDYGIHLREKQKVKRAYGISESQLRKYYRRAASAKATTGILLLTLLERRLDNVVYHLGLAQSRRQARQLITHGHIAVNDGRVDVPSYEVSVGDLVKPRTERGLKLVKENLQVTERRPVPGWLVFQQDPLRGEVTELPTREDISFPIDESLVVEFVSR